MLAKVVEDFKAWQKSLVAETMQDFFTQGKVWGVGAAEEAAASLELLPTDLAAVWAVTPQHNAALLLLTWACYFEPQRFRWEHAAVVLHNCVVLDPTAIYMRPALLCCSPCCPLFIAG